MAKYLINYGETYVVWAYKNAIEIDTNDYPELEGLTKEQISDLILEGEFEHKAGVPMLDMLLDEDENSYDEDGHDSWIDVEEVID